MQTPDPAPRMGLQVSQTARPAALQTRAGQLWGRGSNALGNAGASVWQTFLGMFGGA